MIHRHMIHRHMIHMRMMKKISKYNDGNTIPICFKSNCIKSNKLNMFSHELVFINTLTIIILYFIWYCSITIHKIVKNI